MKRSTLNPRGKRAKSWAAFRPIAADFIGRWQGGRCLGPDCQRRWTDVHHVCGRVGDLMTDLSLMIGLCNECNLWCEDHRDEARGLGLRFSGWEVDAGRAAVARFQARGPRW